VGTVAGRQSVMWGTITRVLLPVSCLLCVLACETDRAVTPEPVVQVRGDGDRYAILEDDSEIFSLSVHKWFGGRTAAITITYDAPWGTHEGHHLATDAAISRGLRMDLEMVTWIFQQPERRDLLETYRGELLPHGIRFFGHGHTHALHDTMSYEAAYASFSTCFALMEEWGFRPRAYAYPGSSGLLPSTQKANRDAGFICARSSTIDPSEFHLLPGEAREPENWYLLPSVPFGNGSYRYVQSHDELAPILDQALARTSWVILMYHAIGIPEGWSYYPLEDFRLDLDQIAAGDYWSANLDQAAAYIQERNALQVEAQPLPGAGRTYSLTFRDGLADAIYDEPLSVTFRFAPELEVRQLHIGFADGSEFSAPVLADTAQVNLVPVETDLTLRLE